MKKEEYIKPEIKVFDVDMEADILAGSGPDPKGVKVDYDEDDDNNVINKGPIFAPRHYKPWGDSDDD